MNDKMIQTEIKILAMYLPQYHKVKENDEWWGEGYTDWISTKRAVPLFEGHNEPRIPQDNNYYDLMSKETMIWQADLMHQYDIDGMCIYHYWFKNGRQILEKPAENLLRWKEINMPYCFCWANETWARSWANISGANSWYDNEKTELKDGKAVLLEQQYGNYGDWKKHFEYLLPFFKDKRYLRLDDKPIFLFYKPEEIICLTQMLIYWEELAKEHGLKGIYTIGANLNNGIKDGLDAELYHQPGHTVHFLQMQKVEGVNTLDYDKMWKYILSEQTISPNVIFGGFVDYDDTPRKGKKGVSIVGADPLKFQKYLTELISKNIKNGNGLLFINAWNEWGEGMYLEPDQKNRDAFLKAVKKAKRDAKICPETIKFEYSVEIDKIKSVYSEKNKIDSYFHTLDKWLTIKEKGKCLGQYFQENGVKSVGIYGYGILGKHLVEELYDSDITIKCIIDKKVVNAEHNINIIKPEEQIPDLDMIVVTAYYFWNEIIELIGKKDSYQIVSLETIVNWMLDHENDSFIS